MKKSPTDQQAKTAFHVPVRLSYLTRKDRKAISSYETVISPVLTGSQRTMLGSGSDFSLALLTYIESVLGANFIGLKPPPWVTSVKKKFPQPAGTYVAVTLIGDITKA